MTEINMKLTNHVFVKENLVTIMSKHGSYDIFKCEKCGIKGKTIGLDGTLVVDGRSKKKAHNCPGAQIVTKIRITECKAFGKPFKNLTPGSIHKIVDPPDGKDNSRGVWVMGVGEPVKVLFEEFDEIE